MLQMDEVDRLQQRQIDANRIWIKVCAILIALLTLFGIALFYTIMETSNCPHKDCVHHKLTYAEEHGIK